MTDLFDVKKVLEDILYELKQINRNLEPLSELSELELIRKELNWYGKGFANSLRKELDRIESKLP